MQERLDQVSDCFDYNPHYFDFVHKCEQFQHPQENNELKPLDYLVVILSAVLLKEHVRCPYVYHLADGFRPHSEVLFVTLQKSIDEEITDQFTEEQNVDHDLQIHPVSDIFG